MNMKYILNKNSILVSLSALIVFGGIWAVHEFNFVRDSEAAVSYRVNASQIVHVDEWGTCRDVANNSSGPDTFVPTRIGIEWLSFINNKPNNITLTNCSSGGAGGGGSGYYYECFGRTSARFCVTLPPPAPLGCIYLGRC